jgi:hypothetical protein
MFVNFLWALHRQHRNNCSHFLRRIEFLDTSSLQYYSPLSSKVIEYLVKCFSIVIGQNKADSKSVQSSMKCNVPHAFGNHSRCSESWCGWKLDSSNCKHTNLPYGKDLHGETLKSALEDLFAQVLH